MARAAAAAVWLVVALGCSGPSEEAVPSEPATSAVDVGAEACKGAATQVVEAVERLVSGYSAPALAQAPQTPTGTPSESDTAGTAGPPADDDAGDPGEDLAAAVETAQRTVERLGCSSRAFSADVQAGLEAIEPRGPVATAVLRRVTASVLGDAGREPEERAVAGEAELLEAIARLAPGSTIVLPAGTTELTSSIVLLDGLTLRGAGRDATTLASVAPDAAIIVATDGLVEVADLTLSLTGTDPVSGVVAGPSASLVLEGVRITGATRGAEDGAGGAGVYMSAVGDAGSGRGTTLEVTASAFEDNDWAGIAIAGGHRASIEAATVTDNGEVGILFLDSASGSVGRSTLAGNTIGLAATGEARPTVVDTTVTGGSIGVQVDGQVTIAMQGMRVTGPSSAGILVGGEVTGGITGVTCEDTPYGIVVGDTAAPTLAENDCSMARGG